MGSLQRSKRSDNKQRNVDVRWGIFVRIWLILLFFRAVVNILKQTHNFAMTVIS